MANTLPIESPLDGLWSFATQPCVYVKVKIMYQEKTEARNSKLLFIQTKNLFLTKLHI